MKRRMALSLCLLFLFTLVGCSSYALTEEEEVQRERDTRNAAQALNENSDFGGLQLLQPYKGDGTYVNPLAKKNSGAASVVIDVPSEEVVFDDKTQTSLYGSYWFYPHTTNDLVLTQVRFYEARIRQDVEPTEYPYHIFGVKVGMELQDAVTLLESNGYARQKIEGPYETYKNAGGKRRTIMRNADILVMLDCEVVDGPVDTITIQVFDGRENPKNPGYVY